MSSHHNHPVIPTFEEEPPKPETAEEAFRRHIEKRPLLIAAMMETGISKDIAESLAFGIFCQGVKFGYADAKRFIEIALL